ncbi:MAG TPA: circularly permuted type 2 ATP-grasp protein [Acetobacteraceae bacterium]|nr:circularly permuted type 2 ATP-grasp protein [Acetobacteraceae bacterium]
MALDEMVDGKGGLRPHWRSLLGILTSLGRPVLVERAQRLERIATEEGVSALLPGAPPDPWRFDPIPVLLKQAEFARLASGLAQRARLLEAVLGDLYGPQRLLAEGVLPPALVYANPGFLRPCRTSSGHTSSGHTASGQATPDRPRSGLLQFYAADLVRGFDGAWRVLADRTGWPNGLAHALENRRRLGRILPEIFASHLLCPLEHFTEVWQDALQRLVPHADGDPGGVALLTPGHADSDWFGHVLLARELSCALVEGGDLTVRGGRLFLKTLRGLQPIGVLLRGEPGSRIDPLELAPDAAGVPGLLEAARDGGVHIVNHPGTGLVEAPAFAAFLPALARRLLGEELELPGVETHWLADSAPGGPAARDAVLRDPGAWLVRPALDGAAPALAPATLPEAARQSLLARIAAAGEKYVARSPVMASAAPCLEGGELVPRPLVIRLFLTHAGGAWRAMQGGLGCALADGAAAWPVAAPGLAKDIWVLAEDPLAIAGPPAHRIPALAIRRTAGDLPSRVADNFFWLGRYLERLEGAARLLRAALARLARPSPAPHELAELDVLTACLTQAGVLNAEVVAGLSHLGLSEALLRAAAPWGAIHAMIGRVSRMTGLLRDRVTGEMHTVMARGLRELEDALEQIRPREDAKARETASGAMSRVLVFAATVAGLAAENMVRGGGRLFLDLGRRVERAQAVADELACALELPGADHQPALVEHGLRLALELRDSVITYRSRYSGVLQPAPALDLMLADPGNPRGLAFQLVTAGTLLHEIAGIQDAALPGIAATLLAGAEAMVRDVQAAPDQARAATLLPPRLRALRDDMADLSDLVSRRYFALLPTARSVGIEGGTPALLGAA